MPPGPPAAPGEDRQLWGEQIQGIWNGIAELRGYQPIPDRAVPKIGIPAAMVAEKWGPLTQTKYPELLLLGAMAPYLFSAIVIEWKRGQEQRARKAERQRGDGQQPRTQGPPAARTTPAGGQPVFEGRELEIEGEQE